MARQGVVSNRRRIGLFGAAVIWNVRGLPVWFVKLHEVEPERNPFTVRSLMNGNPVVCAAAGAARRSEAARERKRRM